MAIAVPGEGCAEVLLVHQHPEPSQRTSRGLLADKRLGINAAGYSLGAFILNLQRQQSLLGLPLHGGSFPALLTHQLGIYLLRPPATTLSLPAAQANWLFTAPAQQLGWQLLGSTLAAATTAQQLANAGFVVLAVAPPGCTAQYAYSAAQVAVVSPTTTATPAGILKNGPLLALAASRVPARSLFGRCVTNRRVRYFAFKRPAAAQLQPAFTQVLLNLRYYPDAQYLFDVGPGGRGDAVVVYYNPTGATTYLVMTYGIETSGWARTAWYLPSWPQAAPGPYTTRLAVPKINFTYSISNTSVEYYHVLKQDVITFTPQEGSGGCGSCGFWYSANPRLALAFYVSARAPGALKGHLLTYAGSPLVSAEALINQVYPPGSCVPYMYEGNATDGTNYTGELIWAAKWGPVRSQPGSAVVTFNGGAGIGGPNNGSSSGGLLLQYHGSTTRFIRQSHYRAGLPALQ